MNNNVNLYALKVNILNTWRARQIFKMDYLEFIWERIFLSRTRKN